ncbi:MAG: SWIM zinc finger family protein [Candidatus Thorarchaeota archaeon]
MTEIPEWISDWISKDRLVANKFRISKKYLRRSKRIQFSSGEKTDEGKWSSFHYIIHSAKYGKYNVRYEKGIYQCNCPFFKHRRICSHILGVAQLTNTWPDKSSIFKQE